MLSRHRHGEPEAHVVEGIASAPVQEHVGPDDVPEPGPLSQVVGQEGLPVVVEDREQVFEGILPQQSQLEGQGAGLQSET